MSFENSIQLPPNCTIDKNKYVVWRKQINGISKRLSIGLIEQGQDYLNIAYHQLVVCGKKNVEPNKSISDFPSYHPLYQTWSGMLQRCENPNSDSYHNYGARGISVCDRWQDFSLFVADMGDKPTKKHSIDRIDNNGNYEPGNCRWSSQYRQANNKRTSKKYGYKGQRLTITQWADKYGLPVRLIRKRINNGWCMHDVLNTPPN